MDGAGGVSWARAESWDEGAADLSGAAALELVDAAPVEIQRGTRIVNNAPTRTRQAPRARIVVGRRVQTCRETGAGAVPAARVLAGVSRARTGSGRAALTSGIVIRERERPARPSGSIGNGGTCTGTIPDDRGGGGKGRIIELEEWVSIAATRSALAAMTSPPTALTQSATALGDAGAQACSSATAKSRAVW